MFKTKSIAIKITIMTIIFSLLFTQLGVSAQSLNSLGFTVQESNKKVAAIEDGREETELIVKYRSNDKTKNSASAESVKSNLKLSKLETKKSFSGLEVYEIDKKNDIKKIIKEFEKNPDVLYVQPNYKLEVYGSENPYEFSLYELGDSSDGWYVPYDSAINLGDTWNLTQGAGVLIGVLDTGMDIDHTDLYQNIYLNTNEIVGNGIDDDGNGYIDDVNGWDFANNDSNVNDNDDEYHATHIAGIIAAMDNNVEITGYAPQSRILPLKFINGTSGYTSDAIEAIAYAEQMGVDILNCSWGTTNFNQALFDAINGSPILYVCAAGNNGTNEASYPAAYNLTNVISVGSMSQQESVSVFSNYGYEVDLFAPGENIISTVPGDGYAMSSGTSMAAPFVTAGAALTMAYNPQLNANAASWQILNNVREAEYLEGLCDTSGKLDVYSAVVNSSGTFVPVESGNEEVSVDELIFSLLHSVQSFAELSQEDTSTICDYFAIIGNDIIAAENLGYTIYESLMIAQILAHSDFSLVNIDAMLNDGETTLSLFQKVLDRENNILVYQIETGDLSELDNLFLQGYKVKNVNDAYLVSKALNGNIQTYFSPSATENLNDVIVNLGLQLSSEDFATLNNFLNSYEINKTAFLSHMLNMGYSVTDVVSAVLSYVENLVSQYRLNMEVTPSYNENDNVYDKYFEAPYEHSFSSDYVSGNKGSLQIPSTDISLKGINGLDLNIVSVYSSADASFYDTKTDEQLYTTYAWETYYRFSTNIYSSGGAFLYNIYTGSWQPGGIVYTQAAADQKVAQWNSTHTYMGEYWVNGILEGYEYHDCEGYSNYTQTQDTSYINAIEEDKYNEEKFMLGVGWSFGFTSIEFEDNKKYLHLGRGESYEIDITTATDDSNIKGYNLVDMIFDTDSGTCTVDGVTSAYVLAYKNGQKEYFSSNGNLIRKSDRYGNSIDFMYTTVDWNSVIDSITDSLGRIIDFNYSNISTGKKIVISYSTDNGTASVEYYMEPAGLDSSEYLLIKKIDQKGNEILYEYNESEAKFSYFTKTNPDYGNFFANLINIEYPSGGEFVINYEKVMGLLGDLGSNEYFRVISTVEMDGLNEYSEITYTYSGNYTGFGNSSVTNPAYLPYSYTYSSTATNSDGISTTTTYNNDHLPVKTETKDSGSALLTQINNTFEADTNLLLAKETKRYNGSQFMQICENYQYDSGDYGDLTGYWGPGTTWSNGTAPSNNNYKTTNTYDSTYHILTQTEFKQDSTTSVRKTFTLDSATSKNIISAITEKGVSGTYTTKDKTEYEYDAYGNVTKQKAYLEEGTTPWTEFVETNFTYDSNNCYLIRTYTEGVRDADNQYITERSGLSSANGTVDTNFEYDVIGNLIKTWDADYNLTQLSYDDLGRMTLQTNPDSTTVSISYNDTTNETTVTDENSNSFKRVYNGLGMHLKDVDVYSGEILSETEYDALGRVLKEKSHDDNSVIEYTYGDDGRLSVMEVYNRYSKLESKESYSYDDANTSGAFAKVTKTVHADNAADNIVTVSYTNKLGQTVKDGYVENSAEYLNEYTYDYLGNVTETKSARHTAETWSEAYTEKFEYDYANRVVKAYNIDGDYASTEYDALGRKVSITDIAGNKANPVYSTEMECDVLGRLIKQEIPFEDDSGTIHKSESKTYYDLNSNVTKSLVKDNASADTTDTYKQSEYTYDIMNRLETVKSYENTTDILYTQYYYNNVGNKLRMYTGLSSPLTITGLDAVSGTDTDYSVTKYEYDRFGNLTRWTDPEGMYESYVYDYNGNLTYKNDRNGNDCGYDYDGLNRVLFEASVNSNDVNAYALNLFSYALIGQLSGMYSSDGLSYTYAYNEVGMLEQELSSDDVYKAYQYDKAGNQINFYLYKDSVLKSDIKHTYDKFNRMEYVLEGTTPKAYYTYDVNGNRESIEYENGNFTEYEYNLANSITTLTNWVDNTETTKLSEFTYEYTLDGNRTKESETVNLETTEYNYDRLGRLLTEVEKDNGTEVESYTYTYDDYSNRETKLMKNGDTTTYDYDSNNRLEEESVLSGNITTVTDYAYDNNGNQISTWEHEEVTNGTGTPTATLVVLGEDSTSTSTFNTYNGFNQLTRTIAKDTVSEYSYNTAGLRTSKTVNGTETRHIWSGANIIFETEGTNEVQYIRGINLISIDDGTTESFYVFNAHGDVVHLTNALGAVTKDYDYDAFGIEDNPDSADSNPFRYCGEYFDKETGTYYLRARYYNPNTGRFISEDSYWGTPGDPLSLNLYVYCANNPVIFIDPSGHIVITTAMIVIALIVGAATGTAMSVIGDKIDNGKIDQPIAHHVIRGTRMSATGAVAVMTGGSSIPVSIFAAGTMDAVGSAAEQIVTTGHIDPVRVATDFVMSGLGTGMGNMMTRAVSSSIPSLVDDSFIAAVSGKNTGSTKTTLDYLDDISQKDGKYYAPEDVIDDIGKLETKGVDFSKLNNNVVQSRPSTEGGISQVVRYSDNNGTRFVIHQVTDKGGSILHRDFDAVKIASGQIINKLK